MNKPDHYSVLSTDSSAKFLTRDPVITKCGGSETDPEADPIVTVFDGWHVDIVSRVELEFDPVFLVEPKKPIHNFAGV